MDAFRIMDRKMAEMLTFHQETDAGLAPEPWAWGYRVRDNIKIESRPATLKEYYQMGGGARNSPFTTFTLKEKYSWSNGNDTVKLRDVVGDDGAIKLVVKPQWRVKIKVEANYVAALKFLKNSIGVTLSEATKEQVPNRITQFYESFTGGKATVWLILDGDVGDRIEFDLDSEYGSIENIYIKTGGEVFSQFMSKMDAGPNDDSMKITLAGVYYKPSEYGEGKIESHREYEIVHDIENGLIQAVDADGQVIFSQTYLVNTDPKAVRNYIVGEIDYAEQVTLREEREGGCPANATYDSENNRCVCDEGYISDMFGENCVEKEETESESQSQGCPANSTKREDGFCYCDEGYKYEDGVCVEDDSAEGLSAMELLERYGLYAVLGVGAVVAVSMLRK